ncbi:hypothetical protein AAMO2058_001142200 [Amorphochlora amoebiformis]
MNTVLKANGRALLIIDVQNDFCPPTGSLKVEDGDAVVPLVNKLRKDVKWDLICLSQDWHPSNHCSFVTNNEGAKIFTEHKLSSGNMQMMWPPHCIQDSKGSEFHKELIVEKSDKIVRKGTHQNVDSYSAFFDNDHKTSTEMANILKKNNIGTVYIAGLAFDYCVGFTALDAVAEKLKTTVIYDACRSVAKETAVEMKKKLQDGGIDLKTTQQVLRELAST